MNAVLDKANTFAEGRLGASPEGDITNKTLIDRVKDLGARISESLKNKAHGDFIDPAYKEMQGILERLSNSLFLVSSLESSAVFASLLNLYLITVRSDKIMNIL